MAVTSIAEVLFDLKAVFDARAVPWYVFGAQAVVVHGRPRMTADVDVTAKSPVREVDDLAANLQRRGFTVRVDELAEFVRRTSVIPVVHDATEIPVDLVLAGPGLEDEFLARAIRIEIEGTDVPFISPEDLIVTKLLAGRPKDVEDVRGILAKQGARIDKRRIEDVLTRIEQALDRSDLTEQFEALDPLTRR